MSSIQEKQQEIVAEFSMLEGDMEMAINYMMELGDQLPAMPEEARTEENVVKGCQSKVWLTADLDDQGNVCFQADSNTAITKGLVSLLTRVLSGEKPDTVLHADITFPQQIGMNRFIGTQRSNGFAAMVKQMKRYALALSSKTQTNA